MTDTVTVTKKRGRPSNGLTKSPAERQRIARSKAHKEILTGDVKNISTSNLVSCMTYFLSQGLDSYVLDICREIERRMIDKLKLQ